MGEPSTVPRWRRLTHAFGVGIGALVLTMMCFLVLPLLQAITKTERADVELRDGFTSLEPPPPPVEDEPEEEEKEPEDKPQLEEPFQPLDLSQLELALNPGMGGGDLVGDFAIKIQGLGGTGGKGMDDLFSLGDLDQKPRPVYRQNPSVSTAMKKRMPCTVYIVCTVDENGRVRDATVQDSDDQLFNGPALAAIKNWKFEPGQRGGKPVPFKIRQPITFK